MKKFVKPSFEEVKEQSISEFEGTFEFLPLERGLGNTLGLALKRTSLSLISSFAPFGIKITGVEHEFQEFEYTVENLIEIIFNLKNLKLAYLGSVPEEDKDKIFKFYFKLEGKKNKILAGDFEKPAEFEIVNKDSVICNIAEEFQNKVSFEIEVFVCYGRGFVEFEENKKVVEKNQEKMFSDIKTGKILAVDSEFSPVSNFAYRVSELSSSSSYVEEKLVINLKTDGKQKAAQVLSEAAKILTSHLEIISVFGLSYQESDKAFVKSEVKVEKKVEVLEEISVLELSIRALNALKREGITTVESLQRISESDLGLIKNLGKKTIEEIKNKLKQYQLKKGGE